MIVDIDIGPGYSLDDDEGTTSFQIACLQLCQASYAEDPNQIRGLVGYVQPMTQGYTWVVMPETVNWDGDGNLAFIARYQHLTGLPSAYAVVIRGTDLDTSRESAIEQILQDLKIDLDTTPSWVGFGSPALYSDGADDGVQNVLGFPYGKSNQSLVDYLTSYLSAADLPWGYPDVFVIGHSLGGNLASVLAPQLASSLGGRNIDTRVIPVTFAAPTAGNSGFVESIPEQCPKSHCVVNDRDAVPLAWWNLKGLTTLYEGWKVQPIEDSIKAARWAAEKAMKAGGWVYAQVPVTRTLHGRQFKGVPVNPSEWPTWEDQAEYNHHTTTYMMLMFGRSIPSLPYNAVAQPEGLLRAPPGMENIYSTPGRVN